MTAVSDIYWPLSVACAVLVAFIGLVHEVIGPTLYPWAPAWFGLFIWHGMGVTIIVLGLICVVTLLGKLSAPVVPIAIILALGGFAAVGLMIYKEDNFHFFALCNSVASLGMIYCYRKSEAYSAD
jgi:hypothetical protein